MIRSFVLLVVSVSASTAMAAATLAKPSKIVKSAPGKTSISKNSIFSSKRPYKIVPMLGVATFKMQGLKLEDLDIDGTKSDDGLAVGAMLEQAYNKDVGLQAGLSYLQLGAKTNTKVQGRDLSLKAKVDYIAIHAAAKRYFMERQLYVKGGIVPMFNLRSDYEITGFVSQKGKFHNIRDMDVLAQIGGGVEFAIQPGVSVGGELTYNRGLLDATTAGLGETHNEGVLLSGFLSL